ALRGCGPRGSRQFITDLENLGLQRGESVSSAHVSLGGATLAKNLPPALRIYADLLRRPHLPAEELDAVRLVATQDMRAIADDPSHKVMLELKRRYYPEPWGRPSEGEEEALAAISIDEVGEHFQRLFRPNGTIIGVAGRIDWPKLKDLVGELLADWRPLAVEEPPGSGRGVKVDHLSHESNQTQIGI